MGDFVFFVWLVLVLILLDFTQALHIYFKKTGTFGLLFLGFIY